MRLLLLPLLVFAVASADWTSIGPFSGPISAGAASPSSPQTIYVSPQSYPTQFLKSTDGGETWSLTGQLGYFARGIAFHPGNPAVAYAAIGSLCRTTDGGTTWNYVTVPSGTYFNAITYSPAAPQRIYATGYVLPNGVSCMGVTYSTDDGVTWDSVCLDTMSYSMGYAIAPDPTDSSIVYCGGYSGQNANVYKSTDGGVTWTAYLAAANAYYIYALHCSPLDPSIVLAGTYNGGIRRSTDAGETWTSVASYGSVQAFAPIPGNLAEIYASNDTSVFRSTDTGRTWTPAGPRVPGNYVRGLFATTTTDGNALYCGSRTGCYKSTDNGASWTPLTDDVAFAKIPLITLSEVEPLAVYAAYKDNALFKSADAGATWNRMPEFLSCGSLCGVLADPGDPDIVWALEGSG
jgi:photosystem II stability/assembly factor-like uncharacterized protein